MSHRETFTADDVDRVVAAIIKYEAQRQRGEWASSFTSYAWAMQEFFLTLPATHELLNSLSAREAFGARVKELWEAHLAMTKEVSHVEGRMLYGYSHAHRHG